MLKLEHLLTQVDFGTNCAEQIRFSVSPELIAARIFSEHLGDNDCLVITGFERFSGHTDFGWKGEIGGGFDDREGGRATNGIG